MKIVGIISSPSYNGNTAVLVRQALAAAKERGATVEEIFLRKYNIQFCQGCMRCMAEGRCSIPDDLEAIRHKVYDCDGIIMGSPSYGIAPNAIMKNFTDRLGMFTVYTSSLVGKYVVGISTAGGIGADQVAKQLAKIVEGIFGSGYVSGTLGVLRGHDRIETKPEAMLKARQLGQRLVEDIEKKRTYPLQNLWGKVIARLVLQRIMRRNLIENRKDRLKAVYENLIARGMFKPIG